MEKFSGFCFVFSPSSYSLSLVLSIIGAFNGKVPWFASNRVIHPDYKSFKVFECMQVKVRKNAQQQNFETAQNLPNNRTLDLPFICSFWVLLLILIP